MNTKKEDEKLVRVTVRVPNYKKEMLKKISVKQGRSESEIVRSGIEKELNIQMYKDSLDFIVKEIDKMIDEKLKPFISSQRKLNAMFLRTTAINTYLQGEIMYQLLGDDMHEKFIKMLKEARKKANYYITHDTDGMSKKDLYDFYTIGELFRNE